MNAPGLSNAATVHVHETGYIGPFTESDTCGANASIALKSGSSGNGQDSDYTVTGNANVQCDATFKDGFNQTASVHIVVTLTPFHINSKKRQ